MSKEDKAKVNIAKAATLLRNVLVFMGLASILIGFSETLFDAPEIANYLFFPIVVGSVIFLLVKSNSQSYKN